VTGVIWGGYTRRRAQKAFWKKGTIRVTQRVGGRLTKNVPGNSKLVKKP